MKMRLMQINIGVGSLPAVSNRIMEIRELRPSVCLSFGGRSVLNHLRLGRGKKSLRAGRPSSDQHLEVSNVKTGGRRRIVYHHKDWQFYITCPVGIGLGCISKWLGWIPTVAPLRASNLPTTTISLFSTH